MAFNPAPSAWLDSWSEDATNITVPLASFPQLTAAEADGTTGDIRKVMFAICEKIWSEWNETAAADRPEQMVISKAVSTNVTTGALTNVYTFRFVNTVLTQDVSDEPA